jgi:hypothetical protein
MSIAATSSTVLQTVEEGYICKGLECTQWWIACLPTVVLIDMEEGCRRLLVWRAVTSTPPTPPIAVQVEGVVDSASTTLLAVIPSQ